MIEAEEISLDIFKLPYIYRILGECLLKSSLPGNAWRTLVDIASLPSNLTCVLEAKPDKLDIKRCKLVFYSSVYQFTS